MKHILFVIGLCLCISSIQAQRYLPGQQGLQVTGGTVDGYGFIHGRNVGYHLGAALSTYTMNGNRWVIGGEYLEKHYCYGHCPLPVSQFTAEGGYYYNFLSNRGKDVFFSIGLSGMAGYEVSNWGKKLLSDGATVQNKDAFVGGGAATFEIEAFVTDRIILLLNLRERLLFGSSVGKFHTQIGMGIKYIIR